MITLIGKRLLDFIIIGGIVFGISYGIWAIGSNMVNKQQGRVAFCEWIKKSYAEQMANQMVQGNYELVDIMVKKLNESADLFSEAENKLEKAKKLNFFLRVASSFIAFLGFISTISIVLRPRELSQKDAFVTTWKFIPKYVTGYFKSDKKGISNL